MPRIVPRLSVPFLLVCLGVPIWKGPSFASASRWGGGGACPACPPCTEATLRSLFGFVSQHPSLYFSVSCLFAGATAGGIIGTLLVSAWRGWCWAAPPAPDVPPAAPAAEKEKSQDDIAHDALAKEERKLAVSAFEVKIRREFKESLSMADNVIEFLDRMATEMAGQLTEKQEATLGVTIKMLKNADSHNLTIPLALAKEGDSLSSHSSMPNLQVQEWLRDCFTTRSTKSNGPKKSMKVVSKSIMFAVRLKKATSVSRQESQPTDFLPFKAESPEQEEAIRKQLEHLDHWNFDIWELSRVSGGREMEIVGWNILHDWGLTKKFGITDDVLRKWLISVQAAYPRANQFHNSTHGSDVMQTTHYMLKTANLQKYISELEILGILVSAMVHDMGHDGYSNNFHKNAVTERAIRFNDQSIQEMYHVSSFFDALQHDESINILKNLTSKQYLELRAIIIRCVLATDMSKHFQELKDFKQLMSEKGRALEEWGECTGNLMSMVLHACDISGQCKPSRLAETWAHKCHEEFFMQGDKEKQMDLPISPLCDRNTTDIASSQVGFISFIVQPTWQAISEFFPKVAEEGFPQLKRNLEYWESQLPKKDGKEKEKEKGKEKEKEKEAPVESIKEETKEEAKA